MPTAESDPETARRQLERVLASPGFSRNERLSRFLSFVVELHLAGRNEDIKESVIAVEVLGRSSDHDPKQDSIVRTEAARLRARLSEYYLGKGKDDPLVIELPKGGYVPVLRPVAPAVEAETLGPEQSTNARLGRVWLAAAIACIAAGVVAAGWWWFHQNAPIPIAVLPLANLNQDPANDFYSDGLTGEIIRNLSIIEGLVVRSQTSSFAFKNKQQNVREAGKQLAADYILEGTVLRADQQLRITAQLVRVRDDFPMWSGKFDRELTDVFAIQDEISRGIVNSLRLRLGAGRRRYETSVDAYDLYLRARALQMQLGLPGVSASVPLFEEAIAMDSSFAPAYAGVASAYAAISATFPNLERREDLLAQMRAAAEKAIRLDPLLAEAHDALGMACARDAKWKQSERSFRRAIEVDPSRSESYGHFVMYFLLVLGQSKEALYQLRVAERTDPLSPQIQYDLAYVLTSAGRFDEATGHCEKLPADYPQKSECLGRSRLGQGRISDAVQILTTTANQGYLGYAYARAGRREDAEKVAADIAPNPFNQALVFAGLGDREHTLDALERMAVLGPVRIGRALTFPEFAFVRYDPRIKALRKKVGLPE